MVYTYNRQGQYKYEYTLLFSIDYRALIEKIFGYLKKNNDPIMEPTAKTVYTSA